MSENLLYFPYINLPQTDWTVRTLLYYEKVGSIVPTEFFFEPESNYDPFMLDLIRQELIVPINPNEQLDHPSQLNAPFLEFINSKSYELEIKRHYFRLANEGTTAFQNYRSEPATVNSQKFDKELIYSLSELGLARQFKDNWYSVESSTANYLMAYLASVLGGKLNMLPGTDDVYSIDSLSEFWQVDNEIDKSRYAILDELIPMPEEISLTKLQKFKDKNFQNLIFFRNIVEQVIMNPIYNDEKLLTEKIKELKYQKELLSAKMNESKLGTIFFGTVCGIFGAFQGLTQAETTGAIIGGLPGFASAIYAALRIERAENTFDQTGMKYLALVDKRLRLAH